ncbi:hypothetical protein T484DRAFT_1857819 [Baffinella frigidus]|nr:hypothetical protein T484DRAFT_1857819 [Cryptophyta sp. CCMP2293]
MGERTPASFLARKPASEREPLTDRAAEAARIKVMESDDAVEIISLMSAHEKSEGVQFRGCMSLWHLADGHNIEASLAEKGVIEAVNPHL